MEQSKAYKSEEEYKKALEEHASRNLQGQLDASWPASPEHEPRAHHSAAMIMRSPQHLLKRAEMDRENRVTALCVIENVSLEWAVTLGVAWQIEPGFFIEYLKEPDTPTRLFSFDQGRVPGSDGGLQSDKGGPRWLTMRGVVEYGKRQSHSNELTMRNDTIRAFGEMKSTVSEKHLWHTNLSVYRVHDKLSMSSTAHCQHRVVRLSLTLTHGSQA